MPIEPESSEEALRKIVPVKSVQEQLVHIANIEPHIENKQSKNSDQEVLLPDPKLYVVNELEYANGPLSEGQRPDAAYYIATLMNEFGINEDIQEMRGGGPVLTAEQLEQLDNYMKTIEDSQNKLIESMDNQGTEKVLDVIGFLSSEHRRAEYELSRRKVAQIGVSNV